MNSKTSRSLKRYAEWLHRQNDKLSVQELYTVMKKMYSELPAKDKEILHKYIEGLYATS